MTLRECLHQLPIETRLINILALRKSERETTVRELLEHWHAKHLDEDGYRIEEDTYRQKPVRRIKFHNGMIAFLEVA